MSNPPFWGDVGLKMWSLFFNSGAQSPIFGYLQMPKVSIFKLDKGQPSQFLQCLATLHNKSRERCAASCITFVTTFELGIISIFSLDPDFKCKKTYIVSHSVHIIVELSV